jgi:hypothetical protein
LFVLLYFFFWPLCCLFFLDIQILITPLISSSSSYNQFLISFTFSVVGHAKLLISEIKHWISWAEFCVIFQWEIVLKASQKLQTWLRPNSTLFIFFVLFLLSIVLSVLLKIIVSDCLSIFNYTTSEFWITFWYHQNFLL